jgi:DNA-binding IclR family transcriptional regulator
MATDAAALSATLSASLSAPIERSGADPANGDQSVGLVQSVDRALCILEVLARDGEAGVTDIATDLGVHKSTAFRLLATLEAHRLVEQDGERGRYRLGVGNLRLAGATTARLDLVQEARPVCRQLAADTGETVNITVRAETSALYLDQVAGSSALQSHNWVGQHIPLHATSNGKVLLSELDEAQRRKAVRELPRYTDQTVTSMAKLSAELEQVREQGYAVAVDELETGLTAVAGPIRNAHGDVIASISVSGPSFRLAGDKLDRAIPLLLAAALEVSHRLGWGERE